MTWAQAFHDVGIVMAIPACVAAFFWGLARLSQ